MNRRTLTLALLLSGGTLACAQAPTTVQLPTFSYFTVQTTVLVPDGGGAYLGGISRGRSGSSSRGVPLGGRSPLLTNRALSSANQGGGMSVHATIIDNAEIDERVLAEGLARRGLPENAVAQGLTGDSPAAVRPAVTSAAQAGATGVAEIRRQRVAEEAAKTSAEETAASEFFAKAANYELGGQVGQAKIYYRMAAARAGGQLRAEALARIAVLEGKRSPGLAQETR